MRAKSRRAFVSGAAGIGATGLGLRYFSKASSRQFEVPVRLTTPNVSEGHLVRSMRPETFPIRGKKTIVITGGGIAGLSAGWWLKKQGFDDFILIELEAEVGGNARNGENSISKYPLGAHYIPLPPEEAIYVRSLFEDMGIITGYEPDGKPTYDELALCQSPKERLLINGQWQEQIVPQFGIPKSDRDHIDQFQKFVSSFAEKRGTDGKRAFASPMEHSSQDPEFTKFDKLSVKELLETMNLNSSYLSWYLNFCMRDDFGCNIEHASAWSMLHYFNARSGNDGEVVTWPEGNGHIVSYLRKQLAGHIQTGKSVLGIEKSQGEYLVKVHDPGSAPYRVNTSPDAYYAIQAEAVICALPKPIADRIVQNRLGASPSEPSQFTYAPWLVANLQLREPPHGSPDAYGAPLAWDNVSFNSGSLGYVVANHQSLARPKLRNEATHITYYFPITDVEPMVARRLMFEVTPEVWRDHILLDLESMHSGISDLVTAVDIQLWPHAMIRPLPGFITSNERRFAQRPFDGISFAHSDLSGMSLFEEAQHHGVRAAQEALHYTKQQRGAPS